MAFTLSGRVVDQDGALLSNVTLHLTRAIGPRGDHRSGGRKIVSASVEIYLHPDGTTNLDDLSKF